MGCNDSKLSSTWCGSPITTDGRSQDWDGIPRKIYEEPLVSVGVCNDSSNLYLMLHVNTANLVQVVERRGVTVWFDKNGKKKKSFGVTYQAGRFQNPSTDQQPPVEGDMDNHGGDSEATSPRPPAPVGLAVLYGSERNRIPIRADEAGVPAAEFKREGRGYTCEFSIPLDSATAEFAIGASPGSVISMGVMLGGESPQKGRGKRGGPEGGRGGGRGRHGGGEEGMGGPGGGGMPGGGGGMSGGGGRGGGMPGGQGRPGEGSERPDQASSESSEFWTQVVLALPAVKTPAAK
jgi:hypothetical protein